jgi:6-phosphogluconolactonase (cycloisomerase 2 family)
MRRRLLLGLGFLGAVGAGVGVGCTDSGGTLAPNYDAGTFEGGPLPGYDATTEDVITVPDGNGPPPDASAPDASSPPDSGRDAAVDSSVHDSNAADVSDAASPDTSASDAGDASSADAAPVDAADAALVDAADAGPSFTHFVLMGGQALVEAFGIDEASGTLTAINQTPVGGNAFGQTSGTNTLATAATPDGKYVYTADTHAFGIWGFGFTKGLLTPIDADPTTAGIQAFPCGNGGRFVVATSKFVFTANETASSISRFSIGANGVLTSLGDVALVAGAAEKAIAVDATEKFLFSFNYSPGTISVFTIDGAGGLTIVDQDPVKPGQQDFAVAADWMGALHPTLRMLYVAGGPYTSELDTLSYDANGVLSKVGPTLGTGVDGGANPSTFGLTVNPGGTFLYAVNYGGATGINIYALDGAGLPTAAGTLAGYSNARAVSVDPGGGYLFIGGDQGYLSTYAITPGTGALTLLTPNTPSPSSGYSDPTIVIP